MKTFLMFLAVFTLALVGGALGASNKINWITQILNGPASSLAATDATGATTFLQLGTNLSVVAGKLNASASAPVNLANAVKLPGVPNGTLTTFTLTNTPTSQVSIDVNGLTLDPSQFTVAGSVVTFAVAPLATDNLQATYLF